MINYNSIMYWEPFIRKNRTLRERVFKYDYITDETIYLHYTIFSKKSGVESGWVPAPNLQAFLGYIQYCFLPEAYYTWLYGEEKSISKVPIVTVDTILKEAIRNNKINKEDQKHIKDDMECLNRLWRLRRENSKSEIQMFCSKFNLNWLGDSNSFLYMKAFFSPKELGEFVFDTVCETNYRECISKNISMSKEKWLKFCDEVSKDKEKGEEFKGYLFKELKDIV
ncbi:MAG: hypothetical protein Q4B63_02665 [Clostridium perfringens]|nr:hypothetical protein [Clostridium perfringens]